MTRQDPLFEESGDGYFSLPEDVPVSTIFIDESGSRDAPSGLFVIGFIKVRETAKLDREIRHLRQQFKMFEEIKFGTVNRYNSNFLCIW